MKRIQPFSITLIAKKSDVENHPSLIAKMKDEARKKLGSPRVEISHIEVATTKMTDGYNRVCVRITWAPSN